ncbi:hypothetical protein ACFXAZ_23420 [Streptomyces sp. NPDC059477]|uniref:hypothetical protein n=1 Tax=Streptomyces sp. NPDC059477 TaxID=3346847 RepID=UPI00369B9D61
MQSRSPYRRASSRACAMPRNSSKSGMVPSSASIVVVDPSRASVRNARRMACAAANGPSAR